jgi:cytochrome c556
MMRFVWLLFVLGACSEATTYEPKEDLRAAMQERMADMKRIKAALDAGEPLTREPLTTFAGLPHSEFVDGVEQYQDALAAFDVMYAGLFTAADKQAQYAIVAATCESCHMQVCPGPLRAIRKLSD